MTFVVTLIALLIERFFDWSHLRHWNWYAAYQRYIMQRFAKQQPFFILAAIIVPLLVAVAIIGYVLGGYLYGVVSLLFQLFILLYCLGPQNLWADAFSCLNALKQGDAQLVSEKLKTSFGEVEHGSLPLHQSLLNHIFIEANRRVFVVVFWYLILGPVGAVLSRAITLSASGLQKYEISPVVTSAARSVESVLDWVPVRLFTFILALGGHFTHVFKNWRRKVMQGLSSNEVMLTECGAAALDDEVTQEGALVKSAISLLDRAFVIMLVLVAVVVLLF